MVLSSLKTTRELFSNPFGMPAEPQWSNFSQAWQKGLADFVVNSIFVTTTSVILIVLISGLAAYALARLQFTGRTWIYALLIAGYAIPIHIILVPLYQILNNLGWLNSYHGLIGPYVAMGIPFSVLVLYAFFLEFPKDVEDAAQLDGCSLWQMLWHVVLPLSRTGLASVAIFQTVFVWNEFLLALIIIRDDGLKTITLGLTTFQGQWATNWPLMLAALTMASLPLLVVYLMLQRQFINSLAGLSR
jgi:multiple sugar transport system permease protein/raffinose/stachyose/melibiose transport system permease protein